MIKSRKSIITGTIAISFSAMLWGLDGVVLTPRLYNLDVFYVVFVLHAIPFIIMNFFFSKEYSKIKLFNQSDYITLLLISVFGGAIGTISIVKALFLVNFEQLTVVILLQKLQPIFAISLAAILLKEKLRKNFLFWAGLAIISGYFMTFGFNLPDFNSGGNTIYASLLAFLAAFSFGSSTVFSKKILLKYDFKTATFYRYGITSLFMFIIVIIGGKLPQFHQTTTQNWTYFLLIAITTGSGAIFLFYYGLTRVKAIIATICELFFPMTAIILDYFVNDTILSTVQWISAIVMIFSIIILNARNTKDSATS
ncbi:MAG: EamA family transporter [Bacteroidetes bacterium HGW-Bacteroidetes-17]|jgi:drug/metabolite transporter (DMT)-like permease|nr:MAG: EamA family transporter [Bacteroidetes bacterium HGW-Bacteroidetes-17]